MTRHDTTSGAPEGVITELAKRAMQIAVDGAKRYLQTHNLKADSAKLADAIARHLKAAIPGAVDDAADALGCGMTEIAMTTFAASITLAGIAAAKEVA